MSSEYLRQTSEILCEKSSLKSYFKFLKSVSYLNFSSFTAAIVQFLAILTIYSSLVQVAISLIKIFETKGILSPTCFRPPRQRASGPDRPGPPVRVSTRAPSCPGRGRRRCQGSGDPNGRCGTSCPDRSSAGQLRVPDGTF